MTEHLALPLGYFKRLERRFFQAESWAITGPDHDHEEAWDIIADGIADEDTARLIVTACNCHAELLEALKVALGPVEWMADATDADPEDIERLAFVTEAIRNAEDK